VIRVLIAVAMLLLTVPYNCIGTLNHMSTALHTSPQAPVSVGTSVPYATPTIRLEQTPTDIPVTPTATVRPTVTPVKYAMPPVYYAELLMVETMGNQAFGKTTNTHWKKEFYGKLDYLIKLAEGTPFHGKTVQLKNNFKIGIELHHDRTIEQTLEDISNIKESIE